MRQTREQKQLLKLQLLAQVLGLVDRFGPDRQLDSQLKREQVSSAQTSRVQQQALLPLLLEQQAFMNQNAQDEAAFAKEQRPLQLSQLQGAVDAYDRQAAFDEQTLPDRITASRLGVENAQRQANFDSQTFNDRLQTSAQGVSQGQQALEQMRNTLARQEQERRMWSQGQALEIEAKNAELAYRQALTEGQNLSNRMFAGPTQTAPLTNVSPELQLLDKQWGQGIRMPNQTPEQADVYKKLLPQLLDAVNRNPQAQWSPQTLAVKQYFDNVGGVPYDPTLGITEEELTRLIGPLQNPVQPQRYKAQLPMVGGF